MLSIWRWTSDLNLDFGRWTMMTVRQKHSQTIWSKSTTCAFSSADEPLRSLSYYPVCSGVTQHVGFLLLWESSTLWSSVKNQRCLVRKVQQFASVLKIEYNGTILLKDFVVFCINGFVFCFFFFFAGARSAVLFSFLCWLVKVRAWHPTQPRWKIYTNQTAN